MSNLLKPLLLLTILFTTSCLEEFEDLEPNVLLDDSIPMITVISSEVYYNPPIGTGSIDITFQLSTIYEELTDGQKDNIRRIIAITDSDIIKGSAAPNATTIVATDNEVYDDICYRFLFVTIENEFLRPTTSVHCFEF